MRLTDFSLSTGSSLPGTGMDISSDMFSVSMLKWRGARAQVATKRSKSGGGRQLLSAWLPAGLMPTR